MDIEKVKSFWDENPCGSLEDDNRYIDQPKIPLYADFKAYRGKTVLEIGCGAGHDGLEFVNAGAIYVGIDLSDESINTTRKRFNIAKKACVLRKANAENIIAYDNSFDHVYSFGVIHHSPNPEKIVDEIYRVLKADGTATIMLYNKTSFYYLLEVKIIRKLFFLICHERELCNAVFTLFGKHKAQRFETFREKLAEMKTINKNPTKEEWLSMNTDSVFCPISRVYSKADIKKLFHKFTEVKTSVWFIDKYCSSLWLAFGWITPKFLERWLEIHFGWFRMIQIKKGFPYN